jgi:uncharacterized membrane protein YphA (DoxX/SURF4 family)
MGDSSTYLNTVSLLDILGQLLILSVFWGGAIINVLNWKTAINYMESRGMVWSRPFVLLVTIVWQCIGGLFLIIPSTKNTAVTSLILFTILSSFLCYNFWQREGVDRYQNIIPFLSNVGVIGALLLFLSSPQRLDIIAK